MPAGLVPIIYIVPFVFLGALLYTSVGHGGATVYLAILTLAGFAVGPLVTTVLTLNILAAAIAFFMFSHAGHLRWRLLLSFVLTSVPMAYVGGRPPLSGGVLAPLAVAVLTGAIIGSFAGARRLPPRILYGLLGVVLLVASIKAML